MYVDYEPIEIGDDDEGDDPPYVIEWTNLILHPPSHIKRNLDFYVY